MNVEKPYHVLMAVEQESKSYISQFLDMKDPIEIQAIIYNCLKSLDFLFYESIYGGRSDDTKKSRIEAYMYGFPVFIKTIYRNCESIGNFPLSCSTQSSKIFFDQIIYACELIGLMQNYSEMIRLHLFKVTKNNEKEIFLDYVDTFPWIESIEQEQIKNYSNMMRIGQSSKYDAQLAKQPEIFDEMKSLVFLWKKSFIGYKTNTRIDDFFLEEARIDTLEAVEWNMFPPGCCFGGIPYEKYVNVVVYLMSFAAKHVCFCVIGTELYQNLYLRDLLPTIIDYNEMLNVLSVISNTTSCEASQIMELISLDYTTLQRHTYTRSAPPPLIKISDHQYIRSICGCIDRPFEFLLDSLKSKFEKDWDFNTRLREYEFRDELYTYFLDEQTIKITNPIIIKKGNDVITDIDGCILDRTSGDVVFIQLKWQDFIYSDNKRFSSKRANFYQKTRKWIEDVEEWIKSVTLTELACCLGVPIPAIDKKKIHLIVLGRFHGNFSGSNKPNENVVWGQWYQVLHYLLQLTPQERTLNRLINYLRLENPYNKHVFTRPVIYKIGGKTIRFG